MKAENLVVLHSAIQATKGFTVYRANHFYRCIPDSDTLGFLINGEWFNKQEYNSLFETAQTKILRDFEAMGLLVNGKPISKSAFVKQADIHQYGNGRNNLKIWYFRNSRECIYGFYPMRGTKAENTNQCYQWYLDIINGNMECVDEHDVMFGNCGIPLAYGELRIM